MMARKNIQQSNKRLVWKLAVVTLAMFGFGFAMVPLYNVFCDITGINGKTGQVDAQTAAASKVDKSRTVTVEFTGHANSGLPWEFRPLQKKIDVHPGQAVVIKYYARNVSDEVIIGQAIPSVTPGQAAEHFKKIECFCFSQQKLAPGEAREMPVQFVINPELPRGVQTITLSYAFFNMDKASAKKYGAKGDRAYNQNHGYQAKVHPMASGG
ncbi:MAG: cytochrome c oxidase assembly protein [Gammaproteobacteria bacterium]|nr:MAG: cytochrome c oxidase assembly protein [Gammaproteobacteria bacterium]